MHSGGDELVVVVVVVPPLYKNWAVAKTIQFNVVLDGLVTMINYRQHQSAFVLKLLLGKRESQPGLAELLYPSFFFPYQTFSTHFR